MTTANAISAGTIHFDCFVRLALLMKSLIACLMRVSFLLSVVWNLVRLEPCSQILLHVRNINYP